jgi:hypothetical protein
MTKKVLENKETKEVIAKAIGGGQSQGVLAQALGVSQSSISRLASKEDVKAMIERESLKFLGAVPQAVENLKALVDEMPEIPKGDIKRRDLSFKASKKVLESAGMLNTPSPSQTIVNIYKQTNFISPLVEKLLARFTEAIRQPVSGEEIDWERE